MLVYYRWQLGAVLADYIHMGLVTTVRWPYENCVKNMGSGRKVMLSAPFRDVFMPPRAISQTGALASCYSRWVVDGVGWRCVCCFDCG
jgi:hypothetical protein